MNANITKAIEFLKEQFEKSDYMSRNERSKHYRIEHTMRVASIGKEIAIQEGLDEEALVLGCILHDISYMQEFSSDEDRLNHGRNAAKIARPFLESLQLNVEQIDEICFGIAIHVDDKADFAGERSPLAVSIGDCDNIDRFDVYRVYENMQNVSFGDMAYHEQLDYVNKVLNKLNKYLNMEMATKTATHMWVDKIAFQIQFYERLKSQLECSVIR
jgi:uncharacterized protein